MNSNVNPQGLTNIYWKTFQNSGKVDDFLRYADSKKKFQGAQNFERPIQQNSGFSSSVGQTGRLQ